MKEKATVTMYIYMVTIEILDIYKALQGLMHVFFMLYYVNFCTFCILDPLMQLLLEEGKWKISIPSANNVFIYL